MAYVRRFSNINRFDPLRLTNSKFLFHDSLLVKIILSLIVYKLVIVFGIVQFFGRIIRNNRAILLSGCFA